MEIPLTPSYRFMLLVREWNGFSDTIPTAKTIDRMRAIAAHAKEIKEAHSEDIAGLIYNAANYAPTFEIMPGIEPIVFP